MTTLGATRLDPKVWVGCMGCYNDGHLVGGWCSPDEAADLTVKDLHIGHFGHAKTFRSAELRGHEELWCFDHEGFGGLVKGEISPSGAVAVAELIGRTEDAGIDPRALAAFVDHHGGEVDSPELYDEFRDAYVGEFDDEKTYAMERVDEDLSEWPWNYFDWDSYARDLFVEGYWSTDSPGGIFVFHRI